MLFFIRAQPGRQCFLRLVSTFLETLATFFETGPELRRPAWKLQFPGLCGRGRIEDTVALMFLQGSSEHIRLGKLINMEPEDGPLEIDFPLQPSGFQVPCWFWVANPLPLDKFAVLVQFFATKNWLNQCKVFCFPTCVHTFTLNPRQFCMLMAEALRRRASRLHLWQESNQFFQRVRWFMPCHKSAQFNLCIFVFIYIMCTAIAIAIDFQCSSVHFKSHHFSRLHRLLTRYFLNIIHTYPNLYIYIIYICDR